MNLTGHILTTEIIKILESLLTVDLNAIYHYKFSYLYIFTQYFFRKTKSDTFYQQISKLPGHKFWASLTELKIVFLHNNSISKLANVNYMAASPSISILTLYDTPLSLKPNYRHHLVNSLWSLKSLDYYVISDEEIIEDSSFGGCFSPLQPTFHINVSCSPAKASMVFHAVLAVT